ncbi:hypothetical protein NIIDMKKI_73180 [Mycobacterium kansasii]|uniref:Uncharacterized protein n=1 Tax=Mycobacterium kansasii TaxID=1768 RepID=A0A7G1IPN6_MYCKA|nr:hypothetical protein NIIDMKKI_73180 [Mycobacterium kansasii]
MGGRRTRQSLGHLAVPADTPGRGHRTDLPDTDGAGPFGLSRAIDAMPDKEQKIVFVRLREFETAIDKTLAAIKRLAEHGVR